tara:strand:+ start:1546 stop:1872 length:327 start_codon:yes stop_codon:yes gene_type:complete
MLEEDQKKLLGGTNSRSTIKSSLKGEVADQNELEILLQEVNSSANLLIKKDTQRASFLKRDTLKKSFANNSRSPLDDIRTDDLERDIKSVIDTNHSAMNDTGEITSPA